MDDAPSSSDASTAVALRDEFERLFRRLPADQRAVFVYRHYLGYDLAEIARELDVPLGTVKSRLHYATHALRSAMDADRRAANTKPSEGSA
jgi:RNA polymerase sigma-70 factor (ECF subfamily)